MVALLTFLAIQSARAEYRVFELVITNSATGQERVVISTLDPHQYRTYYPVKLEERVQYRSTWRCRGNTARRPVCPPPDNVTTNRPVTPSPPSLDPQAKP